MWPYFDPDYENISINPPRVCIDNMTCSDSTLVKVDSVNEPGILLEVVQVLSDLDLTISKAYIASDAGWFMDVFHVTDQQGRKIGDRKTIEHIEKALGPESKINGTKGNSQPGKTIGMRSLGDHTAIELIGTDRPGLLSEIFAVLANLRCNVIAAEVWTHNTRVACVVYINDECTCSAVDDTSRLLLIEVQLMNVLRVRSGNDDGKGAHTSFAISSTHVDRRLHQLMFADMDYEPESEINFEDETEKPVISIDRWEDKGYSVVNVRCKDRSKLLFDIVCTLTDMQFVVFHASITSDGPYAVQELYIRQKDGCILDSKDEVKVIKCLEAAILRRVTEGLSLELCGRDRVGLLSDVTRILREYGLSVTRAGVITVGEEAKNVFYVRDASGNPVDMKTIEALRGEIGQKVMLNVKKVPANAKAPEPSGLAKTSFSFVSLLGRFLP